MSTTMRDHSMVCSWCDLVLHRGDPSLPVSHGICQGCVSVYFPEFAERIQNVVEASLDVLHEVKPTEDAV